MYNGKAVNLKSIDAGVYELEFDLQGKSVNKLNNLTLKELREAVSLLAQSRNIKGLLVTSAKPTFIVGADITEFQNNFSLTAEDMKAWINTTHATFRALESLPFPTVSAVNGMALGGGFELALSTDFRVLAADARIGLPEVNLGICPGWGGTVRLSRLIGTEEALKWMLAGKPQKPQIALELGAVDCVVGADDLHQEALSVLQAAMADEKKYIQNRERKQQPLVDSVAVRTELADLNEAYSKKLDPNYPAAGTILDTVLKHSMLDFTDALSTEANSIVALAQSDVAQSLIGLYMNHELLKKKSKAWCKQAAPVEQSAVLGAGIMGGGVAYQSASTGTPIIMKDINDDALQLGSKTATKLLDKQVEKGRLDEAGKARILDSIKPALDYTDFTAVDLVVEAVVENPKVKAAVLADVEQHVSERAVLASNTSTISIDLLAESVQRPEQFCGMHFFNPVHLMPLVEIIRGSKTSDETIATTVAYAAAMGKTPIVVNDCPGFLVNRILFPYFNGFNRLLLDGVDFQRIDRVMEQFGWPMGPAYLADVVGIDTMVHADEVMQQGFPERMGHDGETIVEALMAADCRGQKNGKGFYQYGVDESGRRFKEASGLANELIAERVNQFVEVTDQEIIDRMMIPLCLEAARCLEDGIVGTAEEVDMGLILGLGFPRFRGGPLRYIDTVGLANFAAQSIENKKHGTLYELTEGFKARMLENRTFF
jgi:3-hydroxyacyl-CoA dehydrogenase/enoyl-CoA hydratase/3-hydroxybutyryl-CoA epimerase/enoyl-CoA isomerase